MMEMVSRAALRSFQWIQAVVCEVSSRSLTLLFISVSPCSSAASSFSISNSVSSFLLVLWAASRSLVNIDPSPSAGSLSLSFPHVHIYTHHTPKKMCMSVWTVPLKWWTRFLIHWNGFKSLTLLYFCPTICCHHVDSSDLRFAFVCPVCCVPVFTQVLWSLLKCILVSLPVIWILVFVRCFLPFSICLLAFWVQLLLHPLPLTYTVNVGNVTYIGLYWWYNNKRQVIWVFSCFLVESTATVCLIIIDQEALLYIEQLAMLFDCVGKYYKVMYTTKPQALTHLRLTKVTKVTLCSSDSAFNLEVLRPGSTFCASF